MTRLNSCENTHINNFIVLSTFFCLFFFLTNAVASTPLSIGNIRQLYTINNAPSHPISLPTDVAVDEDGNIYVVDSGHHRIAVFDKDGDHLSYISQKGTKPGQLMNPVGIDVSGSHIYVADKDNHRIEVFSIDGKHEKSIELYENKSPVSPIDVLANNSEKLLYVTGNNNHKVMAYDLSGKLIKQWGGEGTNKGELRYPATLSMYENNIYVVDVLNSRVQTFNSQGVLQAITGEWGVLQGKLFRPKGVALDSKGNIYVSDSYLGVIQVFSNDTRYVYSLGKSGKLYYFSTPVGLFIDKKDHLYVCEMMKNRVSVFSLEQ